MTEQRSLISEADQKIKILEKTVMKLKIERILTISFFVIFCVFAYRKILRAVDEHSYNAAREAGETVADVAGAKGYLLGYGDAVAGKSPDLSTLPQRIREKLPQVKN